MRFAVENEEEPPQLRRLRVLVMVLMVVLILGFLAVVATIVIRLGFGGAAGVTPVTAGEVVLPAGEVLSIGQGRGTVLFLVRTDARERLFVINAETGELVSETEVLRE